MQVSRKLLLLRQASWPNAAVSIVVPEGAGGSNGTGQVYEAKPDGNTILFFHNAVLTNYATGITNYAYSDYALGPHVVTDGATGVKFNIVDVGANAAKAMALLCGHIDILPN